MNHPKITVIGAAIVDILASPVVLSTLQTGSQPMKDILMSFGGDALNEAVVLKKLGADVELVSKVGLDRAGKQVVDFMNEIGILDSSVIKDENTITSINIVLVDEKGERYFLTNPNGSMRTLSERDVEPYLEGASNIVSFASMFVSSEMDIAAMERVFKKIKAKPERLLAVDMTKAKNHETITDIKPLLRYVDFIFPNESEIALLTGKEDRYRNARYLVDFGAKCAVIKCGKDGCLIYKDNQYMELSAYPLQNVVDSTGAGDSFVAGFLYALACGFSLRDCGLFANAVASCIVEKVGANQGIESIDKPYKRFLEMRS